MKLDHSHPHGLTLISRSGAALHGETTPPGDKSISHRAIILGSLAEGETVIGNLLEGEDVLRTVEAFRTMGVAIQHEAAGAWKVRGAGFGGLREPTDVLDMGNSGTAMRLMTGVLAGQKFYSVLTGDASLRGRPMKRVVEPLAAMGARIQGRDGGRLAPLSIQGTRLTPIDHVMTVGSAQVKSALLLAGLMTEGETRVTEPELSRDHSERMLTAFGAEIHREGKSVGIVGGSTLRGVPVWVPGDISSAAFPMVAALLVPGSDVTITNVGVNPTRTGLLDLLEAMGARIERLNPREAGGEPVADLRVRHSELHGIRVPPETVVRAIDEFPIFFVAAACAHGETLLTDAKELRVKESDRIAAMADGLRRIGAELEELPDGVRIQGQPKGLHGGEADSWTDHRIAMSLLVAGLVCKKPVTVSRCDNIHTSFPGFTALMQGLGAGIHPVAGIL